MEKQLKARRKIKLSAYNFIFLTIAGIINAVGVTLLLTPNNLLDSGFSGTAILLDRLTPSYLNLSIFLILLNFPFFIIGYKKLGTTFVIYSLYAIFIYSLAAFVFQNLLNINFALGSPIVKKDILLSALFGGLLSGIGSGLVIRFGGALDGVEVMAVMFAKKFSMTVGTFVMSYNVVLYIITAIIFSSWEIPLYSIVAYAVGIKAVDFIVDGIDKAKALFIITENCDKMTKMLSDNLGRGITIINAKGYYSAKEKAMLYCVANRFEISKIKKLIKEADENAFVTITEITDFFGSKTGIKPKGLLNKKKQNLEVNTLKEAAEQRRREIENIKEKENTSSNLSETATANTTENTAEATAENKN